METTGFGKRLKLYLHEKNISQTTLAEKLSVKKQYLSKMLQDQFNPGMDIVSSIFKLLPDANCRYLITGEKDNQVSMVAEQTAQYHIKCAECQNKQQTINNQNDYINVLKNEVKKCLDDLEKRKAS